LCGLQVEQRRSSAGPPFVLANSRSGGPLGVADLGMPPGEPDCRIVARREESEPQRGKARLFWKRKIARVSNRLGQLGGVLLGGRSRDDDAAHQPWMVGCRHAGDPVSVGVTDDDSTPVPELLYGFGDIAREIMQGDVGHRAATAADPARLWPQHTEARSGQSFCDLVV